MFSGLIWGLALGLLLPRGIRYLRENPDAVRDGVAAFKRRFSA